MDPVEEELANLEKAEADLTARLSYAKLQSFKASKAVAHARDQRQAAASRVEFAQKELRDYWLSFLWSDPELQKELDDAKSDVELAEAANQEADQLVRVKDAAVQDIERQLDALRSDLNRARTKVVAEEQYAAADVAEEEEKEPTEEESLAQDCDATVLLLAGGEYELRQLKKAAQAVLRRIRDLERTIELGRLAEQPQRRVIEQHQQEKNQLMMRGEDLGREIKLLQQQITTAVERHGQANVVATQGSDTSLCREMKRAAMDLALKANAKEVVCAEALGKLYVRTPWFVEKLMSRSMVQRVVQPENVGSQSAWELCEYIDELCKKARNQHYEAVDKMVSFLINANLPAMAHQHLISRVPTLVDHVEKSDRSAMGREHAVCIVAALFPNRNDGSREDTYRVLTRYSLEKSNASNDVGIKRLINEAFLDAQQQDPLLHLTPPVMTALHMIARRGLEMLRKETALLKVDAHTGRKTHHWCIRRAAAARVCDMARGGNEFASNIILEELLKDTQWSVRQPVLCEACRMLGQMEEATNQARQLIEIILNVLTSHVKERAYTGRGHAGAAAQWFDPTDASSLAAVQKSVEKALTRELPRYRPLIQRAVIIELQQVVETGSNTNEEHLAIVQRVLRPLGGLAAVKAAQPQNTLQDDVTQPRSLRA